MIRYAQPIFKTFSLPFFLSYFILSLVFSFEFLAGLYLFFNKYKFAKF
jgi:hypothetical protein